MSDKDGQDKTFSSFTVDATNPGVTQMPGITKLLNRKKLGLPPAVSGGTSGETKGLAPPPFSPVSPVSHPRMEIEIKEPTVRLVDIQINAPEPVTATITRAVKKAMVHPATRREERRSTFRITLWKKQELEKSATPLEKAISLLLQTSAKTSTNRAFFMAQITQQAPRSGARATPVFRSHSAIGERTYLSLWTGFLWNTSLTPEISEQIFKAGASHGLLELAPVQVPGQAPLAPQQNEAHQSFRRAVGCDVEDYLSLFVCGPLNSPTGVLIVFSKASLNQYFPKVRELLLKVPLLLTTETRAA